MNRMSETNLKLFWNPNTILLPRYVWRLNACYNQCFFLCFFNLDNKAFFVNQPSPGGNCHIWGLELGNMGLYPCPDQPHIGVNPELFDHPIIYTPYMWCDKTAILKYKKSCHQIWNYTRRHICMHYGLVRGPSVLIN